MKKIADHLLTPVLCYFLWLGFLFTFQYLFLHYSPITFYVKYYSVEPLNKENIIWDDFYMVSDREVFREVDINWNDILICNNNDKHYRFSSFQSTGRSKIHERKKVTWKYEWTLPKKTTSCYMISTIKTTHNFGISKAKQIVSWPFTFKN